MLNVCLQKSALSAKCPQYFLSVHGDDMHYVICSGFFATPNCILSTRQQLLLQGKRVWHNLIQAKQAGQSHRYYFLHIRTRSVTDPDYWIGGYDANPVPTNCKISGLYGNFQVFRWDPEKKNDATRIYNWMKSNLGIYN